MTRSPGPVDSYTGIYEQEILDGFSSPGLEAEAFVPPLNGYDFGGYQFDRFEFTLNSLDFRSEFGSYWLDAHFDIAMFGSAVPEPVTMTLALATVILIFHRRRLLR